jgi:hypothetical protein
MFIEKLKEALPPNHPEYNWRKCHLSVGEISGGYELTYGCMYEAPGLGFSNLKMLSELFGTDSVDVDNYGEGGCESCDWGSSYGNTIQIRKITKNAGELKKLVGKELYSEKRGG